jgi:hypothetical protein
MYLNDCIMAMVVDYIDDQTSQKQDNREHCKTLSVANTQDDMLCEKMP